MVKPEARNVNGQAASPEEIKAVSQRVVGKLIEQDPNSQHIHNYIVRNIPTEQLPESLADHFAGYDLFGVSVHAVAEPTGASEDYGLTFAFTPQVADEQFNPDSLQYVEDNDLPAAFFHLSFTGRTTPIATNLGSTSGKPSEGFYSGLPSWPITTQDLESLEGFVS